MWTLAPGIVLNCHKSWGELASLATGEIWPLRPEDIPIAQALAAGIDEQEASSHRELAAATELGWARRAETTLDEVLRDRLELLGRRFAWCQSRVAPLVYETILNAHSSRRAFHRGFGQYAALPETAARRVDLVGTKPQRVLVLGDDDFVSLGLAAAGHSVTVLDIDPTLIRLIERTAPSHNPVRTLAHDLREPLPEELIGAFDVFCADPLSGKLALRLFLARGLAALKPGGRGLICVAEPGWDGFEAARRSMGCAMEEHFTDFNHYYGPAINLAFYISDLLLVRATPQTEAVPAGDELVLTPGHSIEDQYLATPATRYAFASVNIDKTQIAHLNTALSLLERAGHLEVASRQFFEDQGVRSYLLLTAAGTAVVVRIELESRAGELFVVPANPALEDALLAALLGPLGIEGRVVQKRRIRNSSAYRLV